MTYTDILNTIDYDGENIKYYNNNENAYFILKKIRMVHMKLWLN